MSGWCRTATRRSAASGLWHAKFQARSNDMLRGSARLPRGVVRYGVAGCAVWCMVVPVVAGVAVSIQASCWLLTAGWGVVRFLFVKFFGGFDGWG